MLVIAHHKISNPKEFWGTAEKVTQNLPATLKVLGIYPSQDQKAGTCLWEANNVQEVQQFLDKHTQGYAENFCYQVNVKESIGLPSLKLSDALAN